MKISLRQLRRMIQETVKVDGIDFDPEDLNLWEDEELEKPDFNHYPDEDLRSFIREIEKILQARRKSALNKPLGQRWRPIPMPPNVSPAEAKKFGFVKFYTDGNSLYAETKTGMVWTSNDYTYGEWKKTGKKAADIGGKKK